MSALHKWQGYRIPKKRKKKSILQFIEYCIYLYTKYYYKPVLNVLKHIENLTNSDGTKQMWEKLKPVLNTCTYGEIISNQYCAYYSKFKKCI